MPYKAIYRSIALIFLSHMKAKELSLNNWVYWVNFQQEDFGSGKPTAIQIWPGNDNSIQIKIFDSTHLVGSNSVRWEANGVNFYLDQREWAGEASKIQRRRIVELDTRLGQSKDYLKRLENIIAGKIVHEN